MSELKISAILCAAGLSTRMAPQNKLLLPYMGSTILGHTVSQLISSHVAELIVVLGHDYRDTLKALEPLKDLIQIIFNENYRKGQTSTIQEGLMYSDPTFQAFMICHADMPLLSAHNYNLLLDHYKQILSTDTRAIARPISNGTPGHPVIMSRAHRSAVLNCGPGEGCREVIQEEKHHLIPYFSEDEAYYLDTDTKVAYEIILDKNQKM